MKILVTGGSGMLGRSLQEIMPDAFYASSENCDLTKQGEVRTMVREYAPDIIIHLAAVVSGIQDNIKRPVNHFEDNLLMNTFLIKAAKEFGVKRFIGMLSTCIYPDVAKSYPLTEDQIHEGPPTQTNFGYGYAKRCMAVMIDQYNNQFGTKYSYLIPANLLGKYDKYSDDRSHYVGALIKKIYEAKIGGADHIELFGNGMPLRQFMLADDLAKIIKLCIENDVTESFNVSPDEVYTIKEIAKIALKACDAQHLKIIFDPTKPNGQMDKTASNKKLKSIFPDFNFTLLHDAIKKTYKEYEKCRQQSL
jgi:GDP-L-fucose synthase